MLIQLASPEDRMSREGRIPARLRHMHNGLQHALLSPPLPPFIKEFPQAVAILPSTPLLSPPLVSSPSTYLRSKHAT